MRLTLDTIEDLLDVIHGEGRRDLDLRAVRFIDPYALLLLDLSVRHAREAGAPLRIQWPSIGPLRDWMRHMRFFSDTKIVTPPADLPPVRDALHPIAPIDSERTVTRLVGAFEQRLSERYPIDPAPRRTFMRVMLELFQNIPQHSNALGEAIDPHGIAAMQDYEDSILLAIGDKGIGFGRSLALRSSLGPLSDEQALHSAVLDGVSRFCDPGHGRELQRIYRWVRSQEGTFVVRSGTALLYQGERGGDIYRVAPFPGVQIALRLPRYVFGIGEHVFGDRGLESIHDSVFNEPDEKDDRPPGSVRTTSGDPAGGG